MILILCLIIFLWSCDVSAQEKDNAIRRKRDYETAERRHREKLAVLRGRNTGRKITRTVAHDSYGRYVAQEIIEDNPDGMIDLDEDWEG